MALKNKVQSIVVTTVWRKNAFLLVSSSSRTFATGYDDNRILKSPSSLVSLDDFPDVWNYSSSTNYTESSTHKLGNSSF
ncbi:hypothetical protein HanOQP8_Chr01g0000671 [Helianthus annuus]|nr:hypothetical protein HanOQP8_Chr01g0000671 [Helianthus annuus]